MNNNNIILKLNKELSKIDNLQDKENYLYNLKIFVENLEKDVHNQKIGITDDNLEAELLKFLHENYEYNFNHKYNCFKFDYYKSYDDYFNIDTIKELLSIKLEERWEYFYDKFCDNEIDFQDNEINEIIENFIKKTTYKEHDTEIQDILINIIEFDFYSEFLNDKYKIEYFKNNRYYEKTLTLNEILNKEKRVFKNITDIKYLE